MEAPPVVTPDNEARRAPWLRRCSVLGFIVSLLAFGPWLLGFGAKWPPTFDPKWAVSSILAVLALVAALVVSRSSRDRSERSAAAITLVIALAACLMVVVNYHDNFRDYPWPFLAPLMLAVPMAAWLCRQRTLALTVALLSGFWFYGAFVPPLGNGPRVVVSGDLSVQIGPPDPGTNGWRFEIKDPSVDDLTAKYDLDNIGVDGRIGTLIPVVCWSPHFWDWMNEGETVTPHMRSGTFRAFVRPWTRSWDARVVVPVWPSESELHVWVEVDSLPRTSRAKSAKFSLEVSATRWTIEKEPHPEGPCLYLTVRYSGPGLSGFNSHETRVTSESGRLLQDSARSVGGSEDGTEVEFEIYPIDRNTRRIRVDLYSRESRARNVVAFDFPRLPNPR